MVFRGAAIKAPPFPSPEEMLAIKSMEHSRKHLRRPRESYLMPRHWGAGSVLATTQRHSAHAGSSGALLSGCHTHKGQHHRCFCRIQKNVINPHKETADSKYNYWEDGGAKEQGKVLGWRKNSSNDSSWHSRRDGHLEAQACFQGRSGLPRNICLVSSVITCVWVSEAEFFFNVFLLW